LANCDGINGPEKGDLSKNRAQYEPAHLERFFERKPVALRIEGCSSQNEKNQTRFAFEGG
jgi:hypothetical protein